MTNETEPCRSPRVCACKFCMAEPVPCDVPFIHTGSGRECFECGGESGHFTYCDKTK